VQRFKRFLEERRDELAALQILYRLPYAQRRLTCEAVDDLKEALKRPPWLLEPVDIWRAYKRLASDKVRGNPAGTLADVVMLVRYAIGDCESLEPLPSVVAGRFNLWLGREEKAGRSYSGEQRAWLMAIRDHLGVPAGNGLSPLMASQLRLATEDNPPRLRPLAALPGSCPDQFPFKLGEAAQNGQHQTTMCRRGVSPSVSERFEARLFFPNRPQQVQKSCGESDIDAGLMQPQPSLGDRALDTCPVFVGTPASAQKWQVNQFDGDPLIPVGFGRVGQLKELARSFIRVTEGSISGKFHELSALRLCGHMDHGVFEMVAVEGFAAGAFHQGTRLLRRQLLTGFPHRIFPRCPVSLIAPLLKVCLSTVRQEHPPRGFKIGAGLVECGSRSVGAIAWMASCHCMGKLEMPKLAYRYDTRDAIACKTRECC
jgi:EcoEI R protein C-terminal